MSSNPGDTTVIWLWLIAGAVLFMAVDSGKLNIEMFAGTLAITYLLTLSNRRYGPR